MTTELAKRSGTNGDAKVLGRIRVLVVEDDPLDAELVLDQLREDGLAIDAEVVADQAGFARALAGFRPDIVLADLSLPGFSGDQALRLLRKRDQRTPFVFVSGTIGERAAVDALRGGATDYILKDSMARLAPAVRRALIEASERRARDAAEDELVRSQRFETMAILAGSLSHDLRNILQPVLMAAQLIRNKVKEPEVMRMCDMVRDCCNQGLELVSAMLALARGSQGARSNRISLAALLEALGLLLRPSLPNQVDLHIEEPEAELELAGNATELQQCLLNLALNSVDAMPKGGRLELSARATNLEPEFFREGEPRNGKGYIHISVSDTGVGMDGDTLARLFTPFFTTKSSGNGLGLVSCRRFVDKHNGVIRVHSELGRGSRFDLYLPVVGDDAEVLYGNVRPGAGQPILVLCDTGPLCEQLVDLLDSHGYSPLLAGGDSEAVRRLGESEGFRAAIVDAELTGEGPLSAIDALRRAGFEGPVLLIEASTDGADDNFPADGRLARPVLAEQLLDCIGRLLAEVGNAKG